MTADNVVPIINALPEEEIDRLYEMLGVRKAEVIGPPLRKPTLSNAESTEYLIGMFQKRWKKNKALRKQDPIINK